MKFFAPALTVVLGLAACGGALAQQQPQGPANALQGFSQNRDKPVHIESTTLEVRDKEKQATFAGNVRVTQGDVALRCKSLMVFYDQEAGVASGGGMQLANPPGGQGGAQKIKKLEARGGVVVTQKEQTVTGELGLFDMATNTVTVSGNVVMTQGQNVLRGEKLVVNLTTGVSRVESTHGGQGRVQGLFQPGGGPGGGAPGQGVPDMKSPFGGQQQQAPRVQQAPQQQPQQAPQGQQETPRASFPARSLY
jgi:lipopolysaccharide export system protein LptA